jgi:hypothetical protein
MENKKNIALIIIGVIVLILISLFIYNSLITKEEIDEITLSFEDLQKKELAAESYMICESIKAEGNRDKCENIYRNPKYSEFTNLINLEREIDDCVLQGKNIRAIVSGDLKECEKIRELKEFEGRDEDKYVQGCKEAIAVINIKTLEECLNFVEEIENADKLCEELIKIKETPSIIYSEEIRYMRNVEEFYVAIIWLGYGTKNVEFCNLLKPGTGLEFITPNEWYIYKRCVYEALEGDIGEDFCSDQPPYKEYIIFQED